MLDQDKNAIISKEELNYYKPMSQISLIFDEYDTDGETGLNFLEFSFFYYHKENSKETCTDWESDLPTNMDIVECSTSNDCFDKATSTYDNSKCLDNETCASVEVDLGEIGSNFDSVSCILTKYCNIDISQFSFGEEKGTIESLDCKNIRQT